MDNVLDFVQNLTWLVLFVLLYRYVQKESLSALLNEAQDLEEHLMTNMAFRMSLQCDVVIAMERVPERSVVQDTHPHEHIDASDEELVAVDTVDVVVVTDRGE